MKREIKQTKKAVSQLAYYLRKKEKAEAKRADDDKAILDLVAFNARITKERDDLKAANSLNAVNQDAFTTISKSRDAWRETARKFEKSAKSRLVWAYVWAFSSISGSAALVVSLTGGL